MKLGDCCRIVGGFVPHDPVELNPVFAWVINQRWPSLEMVIHNAREKVV